MAEVKETKAQRVERLKREKLAWDHLDEIRGFARDGHASIPPEWLGTYFRSWGIYTQGDGVGAVWADKRVKVGVVSNRVVRDRGRLTMRRHGYTCMKEL